jgi:hypothetical protein
MNQAKHQVIKIGDFNGLQRSTHGKWYSNHDELADRMFEIQERKQKISHNLNTAFGFFVYSYAKLKMLSFHYDFILKYFNKSDFQLMVTDTDSYYYALAGESWDVLVKPHLVQEYEIERNLWFPRRIIYDNTGTTIVDETAHKYDNRTAGLFKQEWHGMALVALNSKTYYACGTKNKLSSKGLPKELNKLNSGLYLDVLHSKMSFLGKVHSLRRVEKIFGRVNLLRHGLVYFYPKRQVLSDGISTVPLEI